MLLLHMSMPASCRVLLTLSDALATAASDDESDRCMLSTVSVNDIASADSELAAHYANDIARAENPSMTMPVPVPTHDSQYGWG